MGLLRGIVAAWVLLGGIEARGQDFTYEDLVGLIQRNQRASIEELLGDLPADFRANYTLMRDSKSLQGASPEFPRAILFGTTGKLTCTFNGDPTQRGYDSLECFQFRDAERAFDFRQVRFPTAKNGLKSVQFSRRDRSADGSIACSACHSADPRPNWDSYFLWNGAYGENDDLLHFEEADYSRFVAKRGSHPRYRHLIQESDATAPYLSRYDQLFGTRRPNLRFSELANKWTALRSARMLQARLAEWRLLGFAVRAMECPLTPDQVAMTVAAGLDFFGDTELKAIFDLFGLPSSAWSTQIPGSRPATYFHSTGFGLSTHSIAMSVVQDLARRGDQTLAYGMEKLVAGHASDPVLEFFRDRPLFQAMDSIIPDLYRTDPEVRTLICSRLVEVFLERYLASTAGRLPSPKPS